MGLKQKFKGICLSLILLPHLPLLAEWSSTVSYIGTYHSNILNYSSQDRDRFLNGTELNPSAIRSLDDWRSDLRLTIARSWGRRWWERTRIRLTLNFASHLMNPIKNLGWASVSLTRQFSRQLRGEVYGFYEPRFYIRHYRDVHTGTVQPCTFTLGWMGGSVRYATPWGIFATPGIRYKVYRYNKYFTEYDGEAWEPSLGLSKTWDEWGLVCSYTFSHFTNTGFQADDRLPPEAVGEDSEVGQADYQEDGWSLEVSRKGFFKGREVTFSLTSELKLRYYTTQRPSTLDPIHSERVDRVIEGALAVRSDWTPVWGWEVALQRGRRKSTGDSPSVDLLKSYQYWALTVRFNYRLMK